MAEFWPLKVECFKRLEDYCAHHGARLVLVQSPRYREEPHAHNAWVNVLSQFLASYPDVEFVDLSTCAHPDVFRDKPELFKDGSHLNANGAEIFSTMLAQALQTKPHPSITKIESPTKLAAQPYGPAMSQPAAAQ
jgi:lysophospholipase L1-like esterase